MKPTVWQFFVVGGTLNLASTAAAQIPAAGSAETRAQPENPTNIPAAGSGKTPAPPESAADDSVRTESSAESPASIQNAASPRTKSAGSEPGSEVLEDLSLVELMDVKLTGAGFFALPA